LRIDKKEKTKRPFETNWDQKKDQKRIKKGSKNIFENPKITFLGGYDHG